MNEPQQGLTQRRTKLPLALGWRGHRSYGWLSDAIPQDEIKAEFRRLAKKYDAQA